jgi:hypothetical protein
MTANDKVRDMKSLHLEETSFPHAKEAFATFAQYQSNMDLRVACIGKLLALHRNFEAKNLLEQAALSSYYQRRAIPKSNPRNMLNMAKYGRSFLLECTTFTIGVVIPPDSSNSS